MLDFHRELIGSKLRKIQGILQTIMLAPLFFRNIFGRYEKKEENYSRHSMLYFSLFLAFTSTGYYLSMKYKHQKLYAISYCIFKSLTATKIIE